MPYFWTGVDTRNAILASIIPGTVAALNAGVIGSQRNLQVFNTSTRTPKWALRDPRLFTAIDLAALSPLGYASYLVYKNGGGFDYTDTTVALALYGVNIFGALASTSAYKNKSLKGIALHAGLVHVTALATAIAFGKIDKQAGYWMIPWAIWTGYLTVLALYVHNNNKKALGA